MGLKISFLLEQVEVIEDFAQPNPSVPAQPDPSVQLPIELEF
jgi:hypothetical protein